MIMKGYNTDKQKGDQILNICFLESHVEEIDMTY